MKTSQLTTDAVLAAMCAVLGYVAIDLFAMKISFESIPVILAALMYGPVDGMLVGGIGTFLYQILRYGFDFSTPLWIVPYIVLGLAGGLYAKRHSFNNSFRELLVITIILEIVLFAMNSVSLYIYGRVLNVPTMKLFFPRLALAACKGVVFGLITPKILRSMSRITGNGRHGSGAGRASG